MQIKSLLACLLFSEAALAASLPVRVTSWNVIYDGATLKPNQKPWSERKSRVIAQLAASSAKAPAGSVHVIGLQEIQEQSLNDIKSGLGSKWSHIGFGRDDGAKRGEYGPILYRNDVLKVVYSEMKWLSPTPNVPSFGWGANNRRTVTIGVFEHIATKKRFIHANTHLDHQSSEARTEGIKIVVSRIKAVQEIYGCLGVTLTGDLNSDPKGDAYTTLQKLNYLTDTWTTAKHLGKLDLTATGFTTVGKSRIDFVFFGPVAEKLFEATQVEILDNYVDSIFLSDHRAVVADLKLL